MSEEVWSRRKEAQSFITEENKLAHLHSCHPRDVDHCAPIAARLGHKAVLTCVCEHDVGLII